MCRRLHTKRGETGLTLRHTTDDRDGVPKAAAGWHICLAVAERLLDGQPVGPIRGGDALNHGWQDLHEAYASALAGPPGPATTASALGYRASS
jgi:hypothetical protein